MAAAVESAARDVLGRPPERVGLPFWTDAARCAEAGIATVVFGPIGASAHKTVEWVDLESVRGWPASWPARRSPTAARLPRSSALPHEQVDVPLHTDQRS